MKGYYFITDASCSVAGILRDAEAAVRAGVPMVQYRNKDAATRLQYEEALHIKRLCTGQHIPLIINDRIDIALAVDADGVHLGQTDMPYPEARRLLGPHRLIGLTVHSLAEAEEAVRLGADYLGVSPIFATATKPDAGRPCGLKTLRAIRRACTVPLVAIGGIHPNNLDAVIAAGADMVCAISAVVTKPDVMHVIQAIQRRFTL